MEWSGGLAIVRLCVSANCTGIFMEDVIKSVTEAEQEAERIKEAADIKCAEIIARAEKDAAEILKRSEERLKLYRENALAKAAKDAEDAYKKSVKDSLEEATAYADEVLKKTDKQVTEIVGRIVGGNR